MSSETERCRASTASIRGPPVWLVSSALSARALRSAPLVKPGNARRIGGHGMRLMPGMTFCIEPMINGKGDAVRVLGDGWTVVTRSGSLAAHFEHEIAVTQDGPVILTRP